MFNPYEMTKWQGSEADNSNAGDFCGSNAEAQENSIERSKYFIENYEM